MLYLIRAFVELNLLAVVVTTLMQMKVALRSICDPNATLYCSRNAVFRGKSPSDPEAT